MKRCFTCLLALCLLAVFCLPALAAAPTDARVANAYEHITAALGTDTPGAVVLVMERGEVRMAESFGYPDAARKESLVTMETAFEIGELSALFVALGALSLAGEGKLQMEADVATYLPEDFMKKLAWEHPVTVRQLLCGTAGLEGRTFELTFEKDSHRFVSLEEALLADVPRQVATPDTMIAPSAFGITLAAYVIESVAGVPYTEYVTQNVLAPLGMQKTVLEPTAKATIASPACGHVVTGQGSFAVAPREGRSYSGLYPATGAISTGADLAKLLAFLTGDTEIPTLDRAYLLQTVCAVGELARSAPAFTVRGGAYCVRGGTLYFGAALALNPATGLGAVVLTNAKDSALLDLPEALCGATTGVTVSVGGELPDLKVFKGNYASAALEQHSFVGKLHSMRDAQEVVVNDDGTISFLGMTLRQIAPGIFADVAGDPATAVVQFVRDANGEVTSVITAESGTYLPLPFYYAKMPATVLFFALLGISLYVLLLGIAQLVRLFSKERDGDLRALLADGTTALLALVILLQLLIAVTVGSGALSAFFGAMAVIALFCGLGATVGHIFAFATSLLNRRLHHRVATRAMLFVLYVLLICLFGLTVF